MLHGKLDLTIDVNTEGGHLLLMMFLEETTIFDEGRNNRLYIDIIRSIDPNTIWGLRSLNCFDLDEDVRKYQNKSVNAKAKPLFAVDYMAERLDLSSHDFIDDKEYFSRFLRSGLIANPKVALAFVDHFKTCDADKVLDFCERPVCINGTQKPYNYGYSEMLEYLKLLNDAVEIAPLIESLIKKYSDISDWRNYKSANFVDMLVHLQNETDFELSNDQLTTLVQAAINSDTGSNAVLLFTSGLYEFDTELYNQLHIFVYEKALPALAQEEIDEHVEWYVAANRHSSQIFEDKLRLLDTEFGM